MLPSSGAYFVISSVNHLFAAEKGSQGETGPPKELFPSTRHGMKLPESCLFISRILPPRPYNNYDQKCRKTGHNERRQSHPFT